MCYSSLPTKKRILLLQRPSHWCRETTVGSLSNSLLFISWSEALRLSHRAHTFCWLTYWVNEWSECGTKVSDISPGSFADDSIRVHMQNIFFSHFSQFSWIFFFMLHSRSKTVANSLSLLPQNIPSAICSNLGTGGGGGGSVTALTKRIWKKWLGAVFRTMPALRHWQLPIPDP